MVEDAVKNATPPPHPQHQLSPREAHSQAFFSLTSKGAENKGRFTIIVHVPSFGSVVMVPAVAEHISLLPPQTPQLSRVLFDPMTPSQPIFYHKTRAQHR